MTALRHWLRELFGVVARVTEDIALTGRMRKHTAPEPHPNDNLCVQKTTSDCFGQISWRSHRTMAQNN
jgi:hypothetical protein